ncbi:hypothetical protein DMC25_00160, partial [Caulobacter sp. D4A]
PWARSTRADLVRLVDLAQDERLSTDWDGEVFQADHLVAGQPLRLMAHEVSGGAFYELEAWCFALNVAFVRWSGGYAGSWSAERVVYTGDDEPGSYIADEMDRILIDEATIRELGSFETIIDYFAGAGFEVPPLVVVD